MTQKYPSKASEAIRLYISGKAPPEIVQICKWIEQGMHFTASQSFVIVGVQCGSQALFKAMNFAASPKGLFCDTPDKLNLVANHLEEHGF